jgi:radical SAM superfamily enzyme YgiQ (UPF0313 family)
VRAEVAHAPGRVVLFSDATFGLDKRWTIALMDAIAPFGKKIAIETTLGRLRDPPLLAALARGGVRWLVIGVETLAVRLRKHGARDAERGLADVVARAHDLGMVVQGNFICGLDSDGPESFDDVYDQYDRSGLDAVMIGILTPYPDTGVYRGLQTEGRIIDRDWEHYDCHHVVYRPRRMTVDQLVDGYVGLYRALRRRKSVWREIASGLGTHGLRAESLLMIGNNLYQKFDAIEKTRKLRRNQRDLARLPEPRRTAPNAGRA